MEKEIKLKVQLNERQIPEKIFWSADDDGTQIQECKAFLLSLFSEKDRETMRIDLWTEKMQVQEMDRFFYYTFKGLVETYRKSTNNEELVKAMSSFVTYFGQKTGILAE